MKLAARAAALSLLVVIPLCSTFAQFQPEDKRRTRSWMNTSLTRQISAPIW